MNPKYSVGEVVILQSQALPDYNGEYTVYKILEKGEVAVCRITGRRHSHTAKFGNYGYLLDSPKVNKFSPEGVEAIWAEISLRKKHEPSQVSFQSLIQSINSPVKQEN
jgi:hypothetical protein